MAQLLLAAGTAAALAAGVVIGWLQLDGPSGPEQLLARPLPDVTAAITLPYAGGGCGRHRLCHDVILDPAAERPVRIAVSLPATPARRRCLR